MIFLFSQEHNSRMHKNHFLVEQKKDETKFYLKISIKILVFLTVMTNSDY